MVNVVQEVNVMGIQVFDLFIHGMDERLKFQWALSDQLAIFEDEFTRTFQLFLIFFHSLIIIVTRYEAKEAAQVLSWNSRLAKNVAMPAA